MVFARSKLMIQEWCIEEKPVMLTLNYTGPNPQLAVKKYVELVKTIFSVKDSDIQEKVFNWDRSGKEEKFNIEYEVRKDFDQHSYLFVQGTIDGHIVPSEEFGKEGHVRIRIRGAIRAEYPQDTFWQRSLLYEIIRVFYHKVIYSSNWDKYMYDCRERLTMFMKEMKGYFNLLGKSGM